MAWYETLISWSTHISTLMLLTGALHLALVGVRKAQLAPTHPLKKYGDTGISIALFPLGILQFTSFAVYLWSLLVGIRGPAVLPPEWVQWTIPYTILQAASMVFGGMSAIGQAGRKVPWAVLAGGGVGAIGAGSVWTAASGISLGSYTVLGLAGGIGILLFVSMFYLSLPAQELLKTGGDIFAFSPVAIGNGALMSFLGLMSGLGVVIL